MGPEPVALPAEYRPYQWVSSSAEVSGSVGVPPELILRFDQNVPPLPGTPQVPLARSLASLNLYPDGTYRDLREAAAAYVGVDDWRTVVVGAGADDLILLVARAYLAPGRQAALREPTYSLYRIASQLAGARCTVAGAGGDADASSDAEASSTVHWVCNPNNPTGELLTRAQIAEIAVASPDTLVVVDEAYIEFGGESAVPLVGEYPNVVVLRTMSKAFGLAALRVGYAVASPEVAATLEARRAPGPVSAIGATVAAAALRAPRLEDVRLAIAERERVGAALRAAGYAAVSNAGNFVWLPTAEPLAERLAQHGLLVRSLPEGIRITLRRPAENDLLLAALGAAPDSSEAAGAGGAATGGRQAVVTRVTTETALRIVLDLDGSGRSTIGTGLGFLDHLLTLTAFHAGFDLDIQAAGDLEIDEHHTLEDVLASLGTAVSQALGPREGIARYGSAIVPMDEARATAAVDLVRRAHAEVLLSFHGERVGAVAVSLLAHAVERFAMEAGCTVHLEASGSDDHHVAEAAFKALGQALRMAVAKGDGGIRSTKGAA